MQTNDAQKVIRLQRELDLERHKRLQAEQRAAGLRSAVVRLQAALAQRRAEELTALAAQHAE